PRSHASCIAPISWPSPTRCPRSPPLSSFSFSCSGTPPALHSFPTRRSSDLSDRAARGQHSEEPRVQQRQRPAALGPATRGEQREDRKSTRLNSSHVAISYAVFCLKKKKKKKPTQHHHKNKPNCPKPT